MKLPCSLTIVVRLICLALCLLPLQIIADTQVAACFQNRSPNIPSIPSDPDLSDILRLPNCIKVDSVELGAETPVTIDSTKGGVLVAKPTFKQLTIKKKTDSASPILFLSLVNAASYRQIILFFIEQQQSAGVVSVSTISTWQLGTAFVTSIDAVNETQVEEHPLLGSEAIKINFAELRMTVGSASTCWSIATNTNNCVNTLPLPR
jgi:type VI protein secretion system component Hcp